MQYNYISETSFDMEQLNLIASHTSSSCQDSNHSTTKHRIHGLDNMEINGKSNKRPKNRKSHLFTSLSTSPLFQMKLKFLINFCIIFLFDLLMYKYRNHTIHYHLSIESKMLDNHYNLQYMQICMMNYQYFSR